MYSNSSLCTQFYFHPFKYPTQLYLNSGGGEQSETECLYVAFYNDHNAMMVLLCNTITTHNKG